MSIPKLISFTVPVALEDFSVVIDDGRIYHIHRNPHTMNDNDSILAEVGNDCLFLIKEYTPETTTRGTGGTKRGEGSGLLEEEEGGLEEEDIASSDITLTPDVIGKLIPEPFDDNLILGYTIQEGSPPYTPSSSSMTSSLFQTLNATLSTTTSLVSNELNKINERYHVTQQLQQVNEQYKITETIQTTTRSIDEKYHVSDHVKSAATTLVDATTSTSALVMTQANAINETYHVTENVKSAVTVLTSKVAEIDERYHVTETVKDTAEIVKNKVTDTLRSSGDVLHDPVPEVDPDLDEETHFST
jgi:hypothetical protein